jgi:hypothetical protein
MYKCENLKTIIINKSIRHLFENLTNRVEIKYFEDS